MKKFIAAAPFQDPKGPDISYEVIGTNSRLKSAGEFWSYPVLQLIAGYAEEGDQIAVRIITSRKKECERNYDYIEKEVKDLCDSMKVSCNIESFPIKDDEDIETHLKVFQDLIEWFEEGDVVYACLTYGTKLIPVVEMMAMNFAYRDMDDVRVECIVYGKVDWDNTGEVRKIDRKRIFDVTPLFLMEQITNELANVHHPAPIAMIRKLLAKSDVNADADSRE